mgnify:CR=1 FL=1
MEVFAILKIGDKVKIKEFTAYGDTGIIVKLNPFRRNDIGLYPVYVKTCGGRLPSGKLGFLKDEIEVINHA